MYCKYSFRAISCPTSPGNGKPFDDLVLMPNGKLAALRYHLQQNRTPGHLGTDRIRRKVDIDPRISTHMAEVHLLIQGRQPGIRVNPLGEHW